MIIVIAVVIAIYVWSKRLHIMSTFSHHLLYVPILLLFRGERCYRNSTAIDTQNGGVKCGLSMKTVDFDRDQYFDISETVELKDSCYGSLIGSQIYLI